MKAYRIVKLCKVQEIEQNVIKKKSKKKQQHENEKLMISKMVQISLHKDFFMT